MGNCMFRLCESSLEPLDLEGIRKLIGKQLIYNVADICDDDRVSTGHLTRYCQVLRILSGNTIVIDGYQIKPVRMNVYVSKEKFVKAITFG